MDVKEIAVGNRRYMLKVFLGPLLGWVVLDVLCGVWLLTGQNVILEKVLLFLFAVALYLTIRYLGQKRLEFNLRHADQDKLIRFFHKSVVRAEEANRPAVEAYFSALISCVYGNYEKCEQSLVSVNWADYPPAVEAMGLSVRALAEYLKPGDLEEGLRLAEEALTKTYTLEQPSPALQQSQLGHRVYIQIGHILTRSQDQHTVPELEVLFKVAPVLMKVIIAWGLAHAYARAGNAEKADQMLHYNREVVPYCMPLHRLV